MRLGAAPTSPPHILSVPPCPSLLPGPTAKPTCLELHETQPSPFPLSPTSDSRTTERLCHSNGLPAPSMPPAFSSPELPLGLLGFASDVASGAVGSHGERRSCSPFEGQLLQPPADLGRRLGRLPGSSPHLGSRALQTWTRTRNVSRWTEPFHSSPTFEPVYTFGQKARGKSHAGLVSHQNAGQGVARLYGSESPKVITPSRKLAKLAFRTRQSFDLEENAITYDFPHLHSNVTRSWENCTYPVLCPEACRPAP